MIGFLLAAILAVLAGSVPSNAQTAIVDPATPVFSNLQNDPLYDRDTYQALRDVIIDVSWNQKELGQVLRDLTLTVRTARPISADINFFMSSSAPPDLRHRRVSIMMKRAHVFEVLENLAQQAGITIKVHPGVVLIAPR